MIFIVIFLLIPIFQHKIFNELITEKIDSNFEHKIYYKELFTKKGLLDILQNHNVAMHHKLNFYSQYDFIHSNSSILKSNLFRGLENEIIEWEGFK